MSSKNFICIGCPQGCRLKVTGEGDDLEVKGYKCKRGFDYARQEAVHPVRMLTTVVLVEGRTRPLPVRTQRPIPKELILKAMDQLAQVKVKPPLKLGDVVLSDILGTGVDVIATDDVC
ncbi:DUF1667 domain-containing protein [Caldanaerobius polysaccharolyticus]|uniref:DUF1667 domain-containing protein n=1 Tax=Caldanaerobius polysaccharolyticus TaxID=44256 RepID=UPI00047A9800|nr:DUF1667 domain-containing protein [Caldanaerobius polysaccharolyticus]